MFSSPLYPFRRAIVCCAPRIHVLVSSLSLSPRDCLLRATNTCSRRLFIPFAARLSVARHEYMFSSPLYPFRRAIVCCAPRIHVLVSSLSLSPRDCLFLFMLTCFRLCLFPFALELSVCLVA